MNKKKRKKESKKNAKNWSTEMWFEIETFCSKIYRSATAPTFLSL